MEALSALIKQYEKVAVALSGGLNSAFLLREAVAALGPANVLAITAKTDFMSKRELELAKKIALFADTEHRIVDVDVLALSEVSNNTPLRCANCKRAVFSALANEAWLNGCDILLEGSRKISTSHDCSNVDAELSSFGILSPLMAAESDTEHFFTGEQAGRVPACICLANRIDACKPITVTALEQVEEAAECLYWRGIMNANVSERDGKAIIHIYGEAPREFQEQFDAIKDEITDLGFSAVDVSRDTL